MLVSCASVILFDDLIGDDVCDFLFHVVSNVVHEGVWLLDSNFDKQAAKVRVGAVVFPFGEVQALTDLELEVFLVHCTRGFGGLTDTNLGYCTVVANEC